MSKRIVWITGAGKGIGRALALRLAQKGDVIAASARNVDDLMQLADEAEDGGGVVLCYPLDVADAQAARTVVARIEREHGPIALAVLNAGTHAETSGVNFDLARFRQVVDTNLVGAANCLAAVLPGMSKRRRGQIAVVGSLAGYRGFPTAGAYAASKAGLIALCEAMKPELDAVGVRLQLISPGFVDTPLTQKNTFAMPFLITTDKAVDAIERGLRSKRFEIAFPGAMAFGMRVLRLLPYWLLFALTRRMVRPPRT